MRHRIGLYRCALVALAALGSVLVRPGQAESADRVLVVGEVTTVERGLTTSRFRQLVAEELAGLEGRVPPKATPHVLSASLVRLDARRDADVATASCEVTATLRERPGGSLVAILRGSGKATGDPAELPETREDVVRAAVRSAIRRVPEVLAR